ncbi:MAG: MBL fold metallo-hydrolase [Kofleriaceae bacterium]
MNKSLLAAAMLVSSVAAAGPLQTKVFTGSPGGFLVDSTLVTGDKDAILIDAQFDRADAHRLVAEILESKKNLTTVYITHSHPDHYFGLEVIHQAFPKAKLVALPKTVEEIKKTAAPKVKQWGPMYGDNLTSSPVLPTAMTGTTLTLEGQTLEIHGGVQGDDDNNSYVWIPSIKTVIAGDIIYRGVHVWTAETKVEQRKAWRKTLDELAALKPTTVIAGHKDPKLDDTTAGIDQTRSYLDAFDVAVASSKTSDDAQQKVKKQFASLQLDIILKLGADAQFAAK